MQPAQKRLAIALAVSVCLNLFFLGFAVGRRVHRPDRHLHERGAMHHPGMELGPHGFLRRAGLRDAGPDVERILRERRGALRERRAAIEAARHGVAQSLRAEPFDAQRFRTALGTLQTETAQLQTQMHGAFVDVASSLSAEQRQRLAHAPWFSAP
jgi:uncharacterized membrane protein